jgi:alpha-galactosidase
LLPLLLAHPVRGQENTAALQAREAPPNALWLDALDVKMVSQDYGEPQAGKSVDGKPITLLGVVYPHGIGTHAASRLTVNLKGAAVAFAAVAGVDDEKGKAGSVQFIVLVDGEKRAETPVLRGGDPPVPLTVDLKGAQRLTLLVEDGGDGNANDHADWAGALLTLVPGATDKPVAMPDSFADEPTMPIYMGGDSPVPAIHGPRVTGATPGHAFLFLIPATGSGSLRFGAENLPAGLTLDQKTGIISGALQSAGTTRVTLSVKGQAGEARRTLTIVGGDHPLALTPPLGWNSWNVWADKVDDTRIRAAADQMVAAGLAAHGYQYVNIDDCWQASRDEQGAIRSNTKFPDMQALVDYVHGKGLRIGIYSSPGPKTCGGYTGSWEHEQQDADTYARWGMDYLKYDWCSYSSVATGGSRESRIKPYQVMGEALRKTGRDIVYSLCQYGWSEVWTWGASVGGNCWRTTGDISDRWNSVRAIFTSQNGHERYAGPGHWNDPDMLMVGIVGFGNTHPTHLKPNEQITHVTMWSLLAAPLLMGCDLTRLDPFTKALLTNDEVLDVDQDPLGKAAALVAQQGDGQVWARPLFDGTRAVGLVNLGATRADVSVSWAQLGLSGAQPVRDLWQRLEMGSFASGYTVPVAAHGTVLVKVGQPNKVD